MNGRVRAVLRKEFREYRRNKLIVVTMVLFPALLLGPSLAGLLAINDAPPGLVRALVNQVMLFFLLVPAILPTVVAGYAVIGEREQGTLEPVLSTPVTDGELLLGKAVGASVPGVLFSWGLFILYVGALQLFGAPEVQREALQARHVVAQALVAPAIAVYAIEVAMAISARSTDVRVAQQLSGLAVLPVVGALALFTLRVIEPTVLRYVEAALVLGVIDAVGWLGLRRVFDRERVLTRFG